MKFKLDENMPLAAARMLREAGHDACTVVDQQLLGAKDHPIADICRREGRAIMTLDLDFGDVRSFPPEEHHGIIVLRPAEQERDAVLRLVRVAIEGLAARPLAGHLWSVDERSIRVRGRATMPG